MQVYNEVLLYEECFGMFLLFSSRYLKVKFLLIYLEAVIEPPAASTAFWAAVEKASAVI